MAEVAFQVSDEAQEGRYDGMVRSVRPDGIKIPSTEYGSFFSASHKKPVSLTTPGLLPLYLRKHLLRELEVLRYYDVTPRGDIERRIQQEISNPTQGTAESFAGIHIDPAGIVEHSKRKAAALITKFNSLGYDSNWGFELKEHYAFKVPDLNENDFFFLRRGDIDTTDPLCFCHNKHSYRVGWRTVVSGATETQIDDKALHVEIRRDLPVSKDNIVYTAVR